MPAGLGLFSLILGSLVDQFRPLLLYGDICGHLCFVKAYTFADVSAVEPITFTRLIWAALIGYLAFAEFPDPWVWTGGGMIVAATSYIAHREAAARRMDARQTNELPTKS